MATSEVWERKMRTVFRCLDKKKTGKVGHEEMITFALAFMDHGRIGEEGEKHLRKHLLGFWTELNSDGGEVDADGFVRIHRRLITEPSFGDKTWENCMKNVALSAFQSVANSESGTMGLKEYKEFLKCLGVQNMENAEEVFNGFKKSKNGILELAEFVSIWREFTLSPDDASTNMLFGPLSE